VLAVAAGVDPAAIGAVVEAAPARSHVRGRTAHTLGHAQRAAPPGASAAAIAAKLQTAELAVRASAGWISALPHTHAHCAGPALLARTSPIKHYACRCPASPLPHRQTPPARLPPSSRCVPFAAHSSASPHTHAHCAGPALLGRTSPIKHYACRCPASPLPHRQTLPARPPPSSRCVPPPDAAWHCFLRARTARAPLCLAELHATCAVRAGAGQVRCRSARRYQHASRRARGACLCRAQFGIASCAHALRGPSSAWQNFTLHALCAQVPGKSAAAAPDATNATATEVVVRATLASARPSQPSVRTHALHEPLSA